MKSLYLQVTTFCQFSQKENHKQNVVNVLVMTKSIRRFMIHKTKAYGKQLLQYYLLISGLVSSSSESPPGGQCRCRPLPNFDI